MQDVPDGVGSRRRMCKPLKGTLEHMGHSKGGGTGNYRGIDGDFPVAAKAQPKKLMQTCALVDCVIALYSAHAGHHL